MSIIGQNILAGASGGGDYTIDQSLRFNNADQPYLNKTGFSGTTFLILPQYEDDSNEFTKIIPSEIDQGSIYAAILGSV